LSERIAAQLSVSESTQERSQVIDVWNRTKYIYPELLSPTEKPSWLINPKQILPTDYGLYVLSQAGKRWHVVKRQIGQHVLYVATASNVRPPVRTHDFVLALMFLATLLFCSPLATWLASIEFKHALLSITGGLERLVQVAVPRETMGLVDIEPSGQIPLPGIPVPGNDEAGDLAGELNEAFRVYGRANHALLRELRLANRSTVAQNVFLRSASEELFSPLQQIRDLCVSLHGTALMPEQRADVKVIDQATVQLGEHVGEILKLSELDDWHEMPLQLTDFDMNELAREVMVRLSDRAQPGITAEIAAADNVPTIRADRKRVGQILSNLIENAFKYTPNGYVRVTTIKDRLDDGQPAVHVTVWDSGPGIPTSEQIAIFSEFYRVSEQRNVPGTGLGLAIAYRLTERHNGKIWVESIVGEGSTFHLLLPIFSQWEPA
jgi:signal transduction histidine kinase